LASKVELAVAPQSTSPVAPHARAKLIVPKLVLAGAAQTWMQSAMEVLPAASEGWPAGQAVQGVLPSKLQLPAEHDVS